MLVIGHNLDVIKTANWLNDMDPDGGNAVGEIARTGTPETFATKPRSQTGRFLKEMFERKWVREHVA